MTPLPDIINQNINKYAPAMDALAKGVEMTNCVHDWDWNSVYDELVCRNCGVKLDGVDIVSHMTMLESDLANTRSVWNECETTLATRDELIKRLVEAGDKVIGYSIFEDVPGGAMEKWLNVLDEYRAMKGGDE